MSGPPLAVIAAGGRGRRIGPRSTELPKVMLAVGGKPLLTRQLHLVRNVMGIFRVILIVGHRGDDIRRAYGCGSDFGLEISYIENSDVDGGLGTALLAIEGHVHERFVFLLGDELYINTNHAALRKIAAPYTAVCGVKQTTDIDLIRKNYAVIMEENRITNLIEKPKTVFNGFAGCGTYMLTPDVFRDARETPRCPVSSRLELTDILNHVALRGGVVLPFFLLGDYVNVNTEEDLKLADALCHRVLGHGGHIRVQ